MMSAQVIDLDSRRKVWRVVTGECRSCRSRARAAQPETCPLDHAECHACGAYAFSVTHFDIAGKLVPRFEALS